MQPPRPPPAASSITWHSDVQAYYVYNTRVSGRPRIGRIFLDMFPRDGKYKHAAQFEIRAGVENEQLAEGCLVCNFPKKVRVCTCCIHIPIPIPPS